MSKTPIRIWITAAVVLGAIAISLMDLEIHFKISESNCAEDEESSLFEDEDEDEDEESTLFEKYLYLFRSKEEQKAIEVEFPNYIINHACCRSSQTAIVPTSAITIYNTNVTVYQNVTIHKITFYQYFFVDDCTRSPGSCPINCNCEQQEALFAAYVKYPDSGKSNISQIRLPACCKCVNH